MEQKDQELSGLVKIRLQQRQAEERCTRCGEFVVQIVHLKTKQKKYKEKKRAQQQECQRLQNQLDASRATVILWENAVSYILLCHKNIKLSNKITCAWFWFLT